MDNQKHHKWESSSAVHDLVSLAGFVIRYRWIYLMVCAFVLAVSFYFYHTQTYYTSRITFLVNSSNVAEVLWDRNSDGPVDVINDDRGFNRITQIMYSSQMMDYLISKFDLYTHYKIPRDSDYSYLNVINTLKSRMSVTMDNSKIITVQITDRLDYNVASNMANAIGKKINDINRQITVENLSRKTDIFESLSKDLRTSSSREFAQIDSLLKNIQLIVKTSVHDNSYSELVRMSLSNLQSKSEDYYKDILESYKYRLYSMYSLQEKNLPTISVLEKALPDMESKYSDNIYMYPLLVFFSFFIPLFLFYLVMKISPVVVYIFRKSAELRKSE